MLRKLTFGAAAYFLRSYLGKLSMARQDIFMACNHDSML